MNIFLITLLTGIVATTFMTGFSYALSKILKKQFKEPQLLNYLIDKSRLLNIKLSKEHLLGWVIHFSIGIGFVISMGILWTNYILEPTWISGTYLGLFFGIIGILGWQLFFYVHNEPPKINRNQFYVHLLIAHFIFVFAAIATWRILTSTF